MKQIPKDSWNIIQRIIRRYPENKAEYENTIEAKMMGSSSSQDGQPRSNYPVNKLEAAVISLHTPKMRRMKREIDAVEQAYDKLDEAYRKVIRIRFWSDRSRNMSYCQVERCTSYSERQAKRICKAFVWEVGKNLGEI